MRLLSGTLCTTSDRFVRTRYDRPVAGDAGPEPGEQGRFLSRPLTSFVGGFAIGAGIALSNLPLLAVRKPVRLSGFPEPAARSARTSRLTSVTLSP